MRYFRTLLLNFFNFLIVKNTIYQKHLQEVKLGN